MSGQGTKQANAAITDADVVEIRRLRDQRPRPPLAEVAARFRISESRVSLIANRKAWKHVP